MFLVMILFLFIAILADIKDCLIGLHSTLLALYRPIIALPHVMCGDILAERYALFFAADLDVTCPSPSLTEEEQADRECDEDKHKGSRTGVVVCWKV